MGVHKFRSKAIRFNGFTDGIVVPTGQFKESGVDLLGPAYDAVSGTNANTRMSHATKVGRIHYPNQANPLNGIFGEFTIDAFIVPDYGGVVLEKPGCFQLKAGDPFKEDALTFSVETVGGHFTIETSFNMPVLAESHSGTYTGGEHKPQDLTLGAQPLMLVTAQFTGKEIKLFLNGELVAEMNLVERRILKNTSSDMFIGGRGGEYRGIIESVRLNRGITNPALGNLLVTNETIGLWDFNDDIEVPDVHFFDNAFEASPTQSRDGSGEHTGRLQKPFVLIAYDFSNNGTLGQFRIYDPPANEGGVTDDYSGIELLGAYVTGLTPEQVRQRYSGATLTISGAQRWTNNAEGYINNSTLVASPLNGVVNQAGTHPRTGLTKTPSSLVKNTSGNIMGIGNSADLDPMVNPIERIRIVSLNFSTGIVGCHSVKAKNKAVLGTKNHPEDQGFLFHHDDGTPIWLTLGNADLIIDDGNKEKATSGVTRQKDAFTRARFTKGQRFNDKSGLNNTAYFVNTRSRITTGTAARTTLVDDPEPLQTNLKMWLNAESLDTTGDFSAGNLKRWLDLTSNNFGVYPVGVWQYEASSVHFNNRDCIKATTAAMLHNGTTTGSFAGESVAIDSPSEDMTLFMMIRPVWDAGHAVRLFGVADNHLDGVKAASNYSLQNGLGTVNTATPLATDQESLLVSVVIDRTNTNAYVYHHGVLAASFIGGLPNAFDFVGSDNFALFGRSTTFNSGTPSSGAGADLAPINFRVAEVLIYDTVLSEHDRGVVHGYFTEKYGFI